MKFFKQSVALVFGFLFIAGSVLAQGQKMNSSKADSISDDELQKFANVTTDVQKINKESRMEVQSLLADKEMNMQRFQKIMMSKRNSKMADSINVTEKEQKTLEEIQPKLMEMQQKSRKQMMNSMQENGLNPQRFQTIMRAVRSDPGVMQRFQKIVQDTMEN